MHMNRRWFAFAVTICLLSTSGTLMAQVTTIRVLSQQNRQGTFISGSFVVPPTLNPEPGATTITIRAVMSDNTFEDVDNALILRITISFDGGLTYVPLGAARWEGGPRIGKGGEVNPRPALSSGLLPYQGQLVRAELDVPRRMSVGLDLIFVQ